MKDLLEEIYLWLCVENETMSIIETPWDENGENPKKATLSDEDVKVR